MLEDRFHPTNDSSIVEIQADIKVHVNSDESSNSLKSMESRVENMEKLLHEIHSAVTIEIAAQQEECEDEIDELSNDDIPP